VRLKHKNTITSAPGFGRLELCSSKAETVLLPGLQNGPVHSKRLSVCVHVCVSPLFLFFKELCLILVQDRGKSRIPEKFRS